MRTFISCVSAALLVATAVLWVDSYRYWSGIQWGDTDRRQQWYLQSGRGQTAIYIHIRDELSWHFDPGWSAWRTPIVSNLSDFPLTWKWAGFGFGAERSEKWRQSDLGLLVPHWFLMLLFAVLPLLSVRRYVRHRSRIRQGLCLACGYELRDFAKCPECGAARMAA